jgi:hypothetical protein
MLSEDLIQEALLEIQQNSYQKIQYDTAMKWAARAVAAYRFSVEVTTADVALSAYEAGNEYAAEAVEHIAAIEDGNLLEALSSFLAIEKAQAFEDLVPPTEEEKVEAEKQEKDNLELPKEEKQEEEKEDEAQQ